jgi:tetratricopeptide (TPR) repeat protein
MIANTSTIRDVTRMTAILGRTGLLTVFLLTCAGPAALAQAPRRADVRIKVVTDTAARLRRLPAIGALGLKPGELDAFLAGVLDVDPRASLDVPALTAQLRGLHKDQDASAALLAVWAGIESLHARLPSAGAGTGRLLIDLDVKFLAARCAAARAHTVESPVGGRAASPEGVARAREYAEAALTVAPDSADARVMMGDVYIDARDPDSAAAEYRWALLLEPASSGGHVKLAEALRLGGDFDGAVKELRKAITIDRRSAAAYSDLGLVLRAQGRVTDALVAYGEALRLDPDASDAHNGMAITLAGVGLIAEAIAEFREIVRIDPDSAIGYYNLATALADADLDAESAAALREVIRINPNHYNAHYNLGEMFRLDGKFDDAATQFKEYLRLAPDVAQNRRNIERATRLVEQFGTP